MRLMNLVGDMDGWRGVAHEIALGRELGLGVWLMGWDGGMGPLDQ